MIFRTAKEEVWEDGDSKMGWKNGDRLVKYQQGTTANLRAYPRSDNLDVGTMTDMHSSLRCIWRLCVSYCNLNKIIRWFKYQSWRFDNVIIHRGKAKYRIPKDDIQLSGAKTVVMFDFNTRNKISYDIFVSISSLLGSKIWPLWKSPLTHGTYILP